jgi:hypothetical protein
VGRRLPDEDEVACAGAVTPLTSTRRGASGPIVQAVVSLTALSEAR